MIEFQLDATSGVATYLQLVQQVHQALQLGLLEPGDQLPTAQQVVAKLAINPNTVLKAYRDLEREGLVRPGRDKGPSSSGRCLRTDPLVKQALLLEGDELVVARSRGPPASRPTISRRSTAPRSATPSPKVSHERRHRSEWPRQAVPPGVGASRLHAVDPRGQSRRARRPERSG